MNIIDIVLDASAIPFYEADLDSLKGAGLGWAVYAGKEGYLGHIPGAQLFLSHDPEGHIAARNDGPIVVEHQMGDEKTINTFMQSQGIAKDSIVVLTSSDLRNPPFCATRAFTTLRYYGGRWRP